MTKDHERTLADGLAKKETDWSGKYKKLADQANSLKQKSETEIMQLKQSLSEGTLTTLYHHLLCTYCI